MLVKDLTTFDAGVKRGFLQAEYLVLSFRAGWVPIDLLGATNGCLVSF